MATSQGNETLPSVRPSSNQTSSSDSQTESAARCSVFRGQKRKLHKDEQLAKARSQPEYNQVSNSVSFKYSAGGSAVCISRSAANTVTETAQATQVYTRNTAAYLHFLERKIKLINSKVDVYNKYTESKIRLINSKISSHARHLDRIFQLINDNKGVHADAVQEIQRLKDEQDFYAYDDIDTNIKLLQDSHADVMREIECLNARRDSDTQASEEIKRLWKASKYIDANELNKKIRNEFIEKDYFDQIINKKIEQLNAKKDAYAHDLGNQMKLLNAKQLYGDDLDRQIKLQSARRDSSSRKLARLMPLMYIRVNLYERDLGRRVRLLNYKVASRVHDIRSEHELLTSKTAPFACKLEGQLQLLASKFTLCNKDVNRQQEQLNSNINAYYNNADEQTKLVKRDLLHS